MSDEREDLKALQTSLGWLRVIAYAKQQWGSAAYARRLENAKDLQEIGALKLAHGWLNELVSFPDERLRVLEHSAEREHAAPSMSRRGDL